MIRYKIKKFLFKDRYLSTEVDSLKPILPISFSSKVGRLFKRYWLWLLGLILVTIIFYILSSLNCNFSNYDIDELLRTIIAVPLALIGIIIPLIILSIEFLSKIIDRSFIKMYLEPLRPVEIFAISILYLSVILALIFFHSMYLNDLMSANLSDVLNALHLTGKTNILFASIGLTSVIVPIIGTVILVIKTIKLVLDDSL